MKKPVIVIFVVLGALILLAGVAFAGFRLGFSNGVAQSPAIAQQLQSLQKNDQTLQMPFGYRGFNGGMMYGGRASFMMGRGFMGFHWIGGLLGLLFFGFLIFGVVRMCSFRHMMHHGGPWNGHMPPWAQQSNPQPAQPEEPKTEKK